MNGSWKRMLCLLLTLVLLCQAAPISKAAAVQIALPEVEIGEEETTKPFGWETPIYP